MNKTQAMQKLVTTRTLTRELLRPLGIPAATFERWSAQPVAEQERRLSKAIARTERVLADEKLTRKAKRALARGDIDESFELGLKAANIADGVE